MADDSSSEASDTPDITKVQAADLQKGECEAGDAPHEADATQLWTTSDGDDIGCRWPDRPDVEAGAVEAVTFGGRDVSTEASATSEPGAETSASGMLRAEAGSAEGPEKGAGVQDGRSECKREEVEVDGEVGSTAGGSMEAPCGAPQQWPVDGVPTGDGLTAPRMPKAMEDRPPPLGAGAAGSLAALRRAYDNCEGKAEVGDAAAAKTLQKAPPDAVPLPVEPRLETSSGPFGEGPSERVLEDEWLEVAARTEEMRVREAEGAGKVKVKSDEMSSPISFNEVQVWLSQLPVDGDALRDQHEEVVVAGGCGCLSRRRRMSDVPGLDRKLWKDKDLVISLKLTQFDFNDVTHFRMLRTLYTKLTRNKVCPSIGRHWEVLGFQHTDPRTDLNRSGGLLNVLHLFFFVSHHFELLKATYLLAQDDQQNFPLACVSINITRMVYESFLMGRLSSLCNSGDSRGVLDTTCKVYAGGLFHFYTRWRSQKRTIRDTELTFNEVRALVERRPGSLLSGLEKGAAEQRAKTDPSRFEFTDLAFGAARAPPPPPHGATASSSAAANAIPKRLRNYHDGAVAD